MTGMARPGYAADAGCPRGRGQEAQLAYALPCQISRESQTGFLPPRRRGERRHIQCARASHTDAIYSAVRTCARPRKSQHVRSTTVCTAYSGAMHSLGAHRAGGFLWQVRGCPPIADTASLRTLPQIHAVGRATRTRCGPRLCFTSPHTNRTAPYTRLPAHGTQRHRDVSGNTFEPLCTTIIAITARGLGRTPHEESVPSHGGSAPEPRRSYPIIITHQGRAEQEEPRSGESEVGAHRPTPLSGRGAPPSRVVATGFTRIPRSRFSLQGACQATWPWIQT